MSRAMLLLLVFLNLIIFLKTTEVIHLFSSSRLLVDFDNYYQTVADMRIGQNPYTVPYMQNLGPPLVFAYHLPFQIFPLHTAQTIFLITNLIAGYLTCFLLSFRSRHRLHTTLALTLILFFSFVSRYSLQIGQPILLIGLLITIAIMSPKPLTGISLALLIILKSFFAVSLLALLHTPRMLVISFLTVLAVFVISSPIIRPSWYLYYLSHNFVPTITQPERNTSLNYENQTLKSTLTRLQIPASYPYIWLALLAVIAYFSIKYRSLPISILGSFLMTPVFWQHYLAALFPLFFVALKSSRSPLTLTLTVTSFLLWLPDLRLYDTAVTFLNGLIASHFYISLLILTCVYLYLHIVKPAPRQISSS